MAPTAYPGFTPSVPGFTVERSSYEDNVLFQTFFLGDAIFDPMPIISSTARDTGNSSNTMILRPGLVMARLDADGSWVPYTATANDGSQVAAGVLVQEVNMLDFTTGSAAARLANVVLIKAKLKAGTLLNLDQQARNQLAHRNFDFDDGRYIMPNTFDRWINKTANYTIVASDHGSVFNTYGASGEVDFTLPAIAAGLRFEFLNLAAQTMKIISAEGSNIVGLNNLTATSVAYSTSNQQIGARMSVEAVYVNSSTLRWVISGPVTAQTLA